MPHSFYNAGLTDFELFLRGQGSPWTVDSDSDPDGVFANRLFRAKELVEAISAEFPEIDHVYIPIDQSAPPEAVDLAALQELPTVTAQDLEELADKTVYFACTAEDASAGRFFKLLPVKVIDSGDGEEEPGEAESPGARITSIALENFKGIGDRVEFELRPLTLLFGANSAGKSSILHGLHYAREVFERHNLDADTTTGGGQYIDLGGFEGFVHKRNKEKQVHLRVDLHVDNGELPTFDAHLGGLNAVFDLAFDSFVKKITTVAVELTIGWSTLENCPYVSSTKVDLDGRIFAEITAQPNLHGRVLTLRDLHHPILLTEREVRESEEHQPGLFEGESLLSMAMSHCGEYITPGDGKRIELQGRGDALPPLDHPLEFVGTVLTASADSDEFYDQYQFFNLSTQLVHALSDLVIGPCQLVRDQLRQFHYLGPLRETPPRNFQPPRFADPARWASGLGAWDALQDGSEHFIQSVSEWLGDKDKLDSGYFIESRSYKEIDLADPLIRKLMTGRAFDEVDEDARLDFEKYPTVFRLVIVPNGSDLELRPHDVGIGISQVVPVVVTALHGENRLLAIEQPELHLHPKLQAELGDLFIESALGDPGHLVILETHSEHLILRLLRRIRETADGELPEGRLPLKPNDIAVYFIEGSDTSVKATRLRVDEDGEFLDRWPKGFFEERAQELF